MADSTAPAPASAAAAPGVGGSTTVGAASTEAYPNQPHGCVDGLWESDAAKLAAYLAGNDCGDAGFCNGLCPESLGEAADAPIRFIAEPGRYVLYVSAGCPFAARPWMTSCALGITQSNVIRVARVFPGNSEDGWFVKPVSEAEKKTAAAFEGQDTHDEDDPVFAENGWTHLRQMYLVSTHAWGWGERLGACVRACTRL